MVKLECMTYEDFLKTQPIMSDQLIRYGQKVWDAAVNYSGVVGPSGVTGPSGAVGLVGPSEYAEPSEYAGPLIKLEDLKPGDRILLDNGFTCVPEGVYEVKSMDGRLYFDCSLGEHYLDGCEECGTLIGVLEVYA